LKKCDKIFIQITKNTILLEKKINFRRKKMIDKNTKIGDLLEMAPEKADILLQAGMHCLGCPASQAETLEEACDVHGIDVEELVKELNK
jgi:hydrid cluster protein-associated redox disulfide domain